MLKPSKSELLTQLQIANDRISDLETASLRATTLFTVMQVLGKPLALHDTFETILAQLQRVVPYDSASVQVIQDDRLVIVGGRGFDDLEALLGVGFDLDDESARTTPAGSPARFRPTQWTSSLPPRRSGQVVDLASNEKEDRWHTR